MKMVLWPVEFNGFKVHRRFNVRWHYPIHEVPYWYGEGEEKSEYIEGFEIHHHQDKGTVSRSVPTATRDGSQRKP
jgi:hypothetical protein